jgi:hypothetical protein
MQSNKFCGKCQRTVPDNSQAGHICPHCGAYWSDFTKGDPYETEEMRQKRIQKGIGNLVLVIVIAVICLIIHYY